MLLLVAALVALPSLVRATQHVSASQDSTPIRLNRGFDQPQAKCRPAPPDAPIVVPSALLSATIVPRMPRIAPVDEPLPVSRWIPVPEPPRGPPSIVLA